MQIQIAKVGHTICDCNLDKEIQTLFLQQYWQLFMLESFNWNVCETPGKMHKSHA